MFRLPPTHPNIINQEKIKMSSSPSYFPRLLLYFLLVDMLTNCVINVASIVHIPQEHKSP